MSDLPNTPIVASYTHTAGTITFPTETETLEASIKPIADASGRTVSHCVWTLRLRAILGQSSQPGTTDAQMTLAQKILTQYGGQLIYANAGLGNIQINTGAVKDVIWGPKPRLLRWKPLGQLSAEVDWEVEFHVQEVSGASSYQFSPMEWVYSVVYSIDRSGYSRRTVKGHVRIPQTRATPASRNLTDQADRLRETIWASIPLVPGFRRLPGDFTLSEDACRLEYNIVDEEMPVNIPPVGMVEVSASHTLTSERGTGVVWKGTITGSYEVARNLPRSSAAGWFLLMAQDRMKRAHAATLTVLRGGKLVKEPGQCIPRSLQFSEPEIYGRRCFQGTITYQLALDVKTILLASGLWQPIPGSDWARWSASLAGTAFAPRGNAGLRYDVSQGAIIDLCSSTTQQTLKGQAPPPGNQSLSTQLPRTEVLEGSSWLRFLSTIRFEPRDGTVALKTLPRSQLSLSTIPPADAPSGGYTLSTTPPARALPPPAGSDVVVQQRTTPTWYVWLEGHAVRAAFPVTVPDLVSVAGVPAVRCCREGEGVRHALADNWLGVPIYAAAWNLRYVLAGQPTRDVEIPQVPLQDY